MKAISKLKDDARRHELKEEWEKAIQAYLHALRAGEDGEGELELPLYNRVGDLYLRLGRPNDAVTYYEQAADRYAESGLYNNAIALCNKALRYRPDNMELLRKLGEFSASQGFYIDARRYFLEYAEKQFAAGAADEAINALKSFADVADDPEILELLGQRLAARGRTRDALEELQKAHLLFVKQGLGDRATAVLAEIRGIDPDAALAGVRAGRDAGASMPDEDEDDDADADELPQLADFDFAVDSPPSAARDPGGDASSGSQPDGPEEVQPIDLAHGLTDDMLPDSLADDVAEAAADPLPEEPALLDSIELTGAGGDDVEPGAIDVIEGLESTALDFGDVDVDPEGTDFGLELERDDRSFGAGYLDSLDTPGPRSEEVEDVLHLPSIWDEDEPASFADDDAPDTTGPVPDLPTLDDGDDVVAPSFELLPPDEEPPAEAADELASELPALNETGDEDDADTDAFPLPLLGDEADADHAQLFELPTLDDDGEAGGAVFDLPTFADDERETETGADVFDTTPVELPRPVEDEIDDVSMASFLLPDPEGMETTSGVEDVGDVGEFEGIDDVDDWPGPPGGTRNTDLSEAGAGEATDAEPGWVAWDGDVSDPATPEEAGPALEEPAPEQVVPTPEQVVPTALPPIVDGPSAESEPAPEPGLSEGIDAVDAPADEESQAPEDTAGEVAAGDRAAADQDDSAAGGWTPAEPDPADEGKTPEVEPTPTFGPPPDEGFVDLGAMLADEVEETTRFRVQEKSPTGDEDRDFAELLNQFKEKVSAHVPAEDSAAHYDLGLAFKEMGLVDEAITEFQIALRTGPMRLKIYEELGDCFLQKGQFNIAEKVLRRALDARSEDEHDLLGVYYHLGRAYEELGRRDEARDAFERVLGMDINFRDVAQRLSRL